MDEKPNYSYEVVEVLAVLSESGRWKKELSIVQWGDNIAKYEIRPWNADHTRFGKGVTLSIPELRELKKALNSMDF